MESETTTPGKGTPESATWFRGKLEELGIGQSAFARLLLRLGDDRKHHTILRGVQRMAAGDARVSGEMRAMLNHLVATQAEREQRIGALQKQLDLYRSGRHQLLADRMDVTAQAQHEVERQLTEMRDLPLLATTGAEQQP